MITYYLLKTILADNSKKVFILYLYIFLELLLSIGLDILFSPIWLVVLICKMIRRWVQ